NLDGGVVSRAKASIAGQQNQGQIEAISERRNAGLAQQTFGQFRAVADIDEFIIFDARPTREQGVLQKKIFRLAIEANNDRALAPSSATAKALDVGLADKVTGDPHIEIDDLLRGGFGDGGNRVELGVAEVAARSQIRQNQVAQLELIHD